ncbi:hypothetical protein [Nostoc sp.]|uniref:hypothetical protein n=1 Tax=Nostoc sp. TaxID=1180 RepID=UPI002FF7008D
MTPVASSRETRPRRWLPNDASRLKSGNPPTALAPQCPIPVPYHLIPLVKSSLPSISDIN